MHMRLNLGAILVENSSKKLMYIARKLSDVKHYLYKHNESHLDSVLDRKLW